MIDGPAPSSTATKAVATRATFGQGAGDPVGGRRWRLADILPAPGELAVHPAERGGRAEFYLRTNVVAATVPHGEELAALGLHRPW